MFEAARIEFDDRELTYVVAAIGLINMWNRFGVTFQLTPPSANAPPDNAGRPVLDASMLDEVAVVERQRLLGIAYRMTGSLQRRRRHRARRACCAPTGQHQPRSSHRRPI